MSRIVRNYPKKYSIRLESQLHLRWSAGAAGKPITLNQRFRKNNQKHELQLRRAAGRLVLIVLPEVFVLYVLHKPSIHCICKDNSILKIVFIN
jgi:hypothetical protein